MVSATSCKIVNVSGILLFTAAHLRTAPSMCSEHEAVQASAMWQVSDQHTCDTAGCMSCF
jgi:hypothetical protein